MLNQRKERILKMVIEYHIKTAEPVGSRFLTEQSVLEVSSATVRNELHALEEEDLLTHPHTSAGRIPTEKGYRYYVDHLMKTEEVERSFQKAIEDALSSLSSDEAIQRIAKVIAEYAKNAVIVAFSSNRVYYAGISNLFSQPEFADMSRTVTLSSLFDACEEVMNDVCERMTDEPTVLFGKDNPFGELCGMVGIRLPKKVNSAFAVLGPIRMDYAKIVPAVEYLAAVA